VYRRARVTHDDTISYVSVVWRATWRDTDVAVKDVRNAEGLPALLREAGACAACCVIAFIMRMHAEEMKNLQPHRNVVQFYGCVIDVVIV
jgi:hypothetical protein